MAVKAVRGMDIKLYLEDTMLGGQRNCSLSMSADEIDITCKTSDGQGFGDFLAGMKNAEISCDGLVVLDDAAQTDLFEAFMDGTNVNVVLRNGEEVEGESATVKWTAEAVITKLDLKADYNGVYEYSATLKVRGKLQKVK